MSDNYSDSRNSTAASPAKPVSGDPSWERGVLEKLAFATLKEQRAARRWRIFFRLSTLAVLLFIGFAIANIGHSSYIEPGHDHTALISIEGVIDSEGNNSAEKIILALDDAYDTEHAKGVILHINSPGGSPVQSGMIADEIKRLRAQYPDKPLHVVVGDICASGGYYIAAAANNIYVDKASLVGSIGVIMDSFGVEELMKKVGVERRALTAGANKAFLDPFQPINEEQRKHAQTLLNEIHGQFIQVVKDGRGARLKETPDIFSGLVWNGSKAVELGLADGLGTVDTVARDVIKVPDVVDYSIEENPFERISKRIGTQFGQTLGHAFSQVLFSSNQRLR